METPEIQAMLANLQEPAEVKAALEEAFVPKGTCAVATSAHFNYIIAHLLKGRSPFRIAQLLKDEKHVHVPAHAIRDYQLAHIPPALIRQHLALRALEKLPALDEIATVETLIKLQAGQLADLMDADVQDVIPPEEIRRASELLGKLCKELLEMKVKAGRVIGAPIRHEHDHTGEVTVVPGLSAKEILPGLDQRSVAQAFRVLENVTRSNPNLVQQAMAELDAEEAERAAIPKTPDNKDPLN